MAPGHSDNHLRLRTTWSYTQECPVIKELNKYCIYETFNLSWEKVHVLVGIPQVCFRVVDCPHVYLCTVVSQRGTDYSCGERHCVCATDKAQGSLTWVIMLWSGKKFLNMSRFWCSVVIFFSNKSSLVQVMACWWIGDKPLPEPMITCVEYSVPHSLPYSLSVSARYGMPFVSSVFFLTNVCPVAAQSACAI